MSNRFEDACAGGTLECGGLTPPYPGGPNAVRPYVFEIVAAKTAPQMQCPGPQGRDKLATPFTLSSLSLGGSNLAMRAFRTVTPGERLADPANFRPPVRPPSRP